SCAIIAAGGQHRPLTELIRTWARENEVTLPDLLWRASAVPPFETQLRVVTSAYQFLNSDGDREVVAVAWIPSADLLMGTDSATRELRITWSIADSIIGSARTDESLRVPASARGGGLLSASTVWSGSDATGVTLRVVAVDAQ